MSAPKWSIVLAYYNEREFIEQTLASAVAQKGTSFRLILVDNRSTDDTISVCREFLALHPHVDVRFVDEETPGHVYAIQAGFALVDTPFVAFWDADTVYPADYLLQAERALANPTTAVAQAIDVYVPPHSLAGILRRARMRLTHFALNRQGHTGFFGICARTDAVHRSGGPMNPAWPYVLEDHELLHRLFKVGRGTGSFGLWCMPAPRRSANDHVRWTLFERVLYHLSPFRLKDWFFYSFLARRFEQRRMVQANLRVRDWD